MSGIASHSESYKKNTYYVKNSTVLTSRYCALPMDSASAAEIRDNDFTMQAFNTLCSAEVEERKTTHFP